MSNNNFLSILKTISEMLKCPSCGHSYELKEVQFLSQTDGFSVVHLTCDHCKKPVWVNFFTTSEDPNLRIAQLLRQETFLDMEEITSDEVLTFHETLTRFDGNFKKAFNRN